MRKRLFCFILSVCFIAKLTVAGYSEKMAIASLDYHANYPLKASRPMKDSGSNRWMNAESSKEMSTVHGRVTPNDYRNERTFYVKGRASRESKKLKPKRSMEPETLDGSYDDGPPTTSEIIQSYGYQVQTHEVVTRDGYILTVFRIIVNFKLVVTDTSKAVLLHHGISGNSADWLLGGSESLPFLLARQGYDVWLSNARGTIYSRAHLNFSVNSDKFWDFSFNEIGAYDIPPVLFYIRAVTTSPTRLYFIGHSMGATAFVAGMSLYPENQRLVKMAVLLAPIAFMQKAGGPMKSLVQIDAATITLQLGLREVPLDHMMYRLLFGKYCSTSVNTCSSPLLFATNAAETIQNTETLDLVSRRNQSELSVKMLLHCLQLLKDGSFHMFVKGRSVTWNYEVDTVSVPTVIFSSDSDVLAPTWDVVTLATQLPNILLHQIVGTSNFGHMDFVWGIEAHTVLYPSIVALLDTNDF